MPAACAASTVALLVSDQDAAVGRYGKPLHQVGDHAGAGLAPVAVATVALDDAIGMVGTVFECVDPRTDRGELVRHPAMQRFYIALLVESTGDAGLVGDDEGEIAGLVHEPDGLACAVHPFELAGIEQVACVVVEDAVAVEEDGGARRCRHDGEPQQMFAALLRRSTGILSRILQTRASARPGSPCRRSAARPG
ncbi:hypothetical protein ACVWZ3_005581 [Bradyrhizobium sp. i1.3.6]